MFGNAMYVWDGIAQCMTNMYVRVCMEGVRRERYDFVILCGGRGQIV
jgi:hypothetical protein